MSLLVGVVATPDEGDRRADLEQLEDGAAALLTRHENRVAALDLLWAAVAMDPADDTAHRRLAAGLASDGDVEGAATEYARYTELLLARGELELAIAELDHAAQTLGRGPDLTAAAVLVAAQLPELLRTSRERVGPKVEKIVQLPIAQQTRVVFHTCLHDDGEAAWLQLEGGSEEVLPEQVRLLYRDEVLETRRCIPMPAGRKSHARPDGDSRLWVVLRAPEEMLRAIDRGESDGYRIEALLNGAWLNVDLKDTGCRFGMKRRETRTA